MTFIYLDYNATTPLHPEVFEKISLCLKRCYGNPSSPHMEGQKAREAVDLAREETARLLRCSPDEVVFTSGGSESNNHAIKGAALALREKGRHLITSMVEHPAVLEVCRFLEGEGFHVTYLPVDGTGRVDPLDVKKALRKETVLVSVMLANNEVGTIQPIEEIGALTRKQGVLLHTDAAQAAGKIPVDVDRLNVDLLSLAGHKLYAPKGVGALYVRRGVTLCPFIHGAGHEKGRRAGTENVAGIAGLGAACALAERETVEESMRLRTLRDRLHQAILQEAPDARLNGHPDHRLPNTLSLSFPRLSAPDLIAALDDLALSAGAACHAEGVKASHVLSAMAVPQDLALGTLRFSLGKFTSAEEVDGAARMVLQAIRKLRAG